MGLTGRGGITWPTARYSDTEEDGQRQLWLPNAPGNLKAPPSKRHSLSRRKLRNLSPFQLPWTRLSWLCGERKT